MARSAKEILKDALFESKRSLNTMKSVKAHYQSELRKSKNDVSFNKNKIRAYNDSVKDIRERIKTINGKLKHFRGVK